MDLTEIGKGDVLRHPWELSRLQSIIYIIKKKNHATMADIGSGDAYFAEEVCKATGREIYACDIHYDDLESTLPGLTKVSSISTIPIGSINLALLLDVLEHVEDEDAFLREVSSLLEKDGKMIVTVPAFQWLFGEHDVFLKHFRRYTKEKLQQVLHRNDFVVEKSFYFYTSLFLLRAVSTALSRTRGRKKYTTVVSNWKYSKEHPMTRLLVFLLNVDFRLNRFLSNTLKINLPGLSVCAIVKKSA